MKMSRGRVIVGTALASGAAWLVISTPAFPSVFVSSTSPPASIDLQLQADLQAKGARISLPVTYSCPGDTTYASITVQVTQRAGSVITAASWNDSVRCSGSLTTLTVSLDANSKPFKKGTAAATAELNVYREGPSGWNFHLTDDEVIRIK